MRSDARLRPIGVYSMAVKQFFKVVEQWQYSLQKVVGQDAEGS